MTKSIRITGGCQCGAVRYALHEALTNPHICHCRMCQKAFGSYFAPLAGVSRDAFAITRGALATFRSSELAERGFCAACGTPLTFRFVDSKRISISLGSLDEPGKIQPAIQVGIEARMPWFAMLPQMLGETTEADGDPRIDEIRRSNHQHPDHDTTSWP